MTEEPGRGNEEDDILHRTKKKVRPWGVDENDQSQPFVFSAGSKETPSYKEKLLNLFGEEMSAKMDV